MDFGVDVENEEEEKELTREFAEGGAESTEERIKAAMGGGEDYTQANVGLMVRWANRLPSFIRASRRRPLHERVVQDHLTAEGPRRGIRP